MPNGDIDREDRGADGPALGEVPRQLPLSIREFTGRTDQLAALDKLIDREANFPTNAVVITAVDGAAGIGKTALAVHWAHRVQTQFPDGTLYMNLRGYGPGVPAAPAEVLDSFLQALGIRADAMPQSVDALSARQATGQGRPWPVMMPPAMSWKASRACSPVTRRPSRRSASSSTGQVTRMP
ncbi:ATP-binding protein [Amycolatopsis alba DSM 44262]|uniref:ATP-binding protein n=1 Tax=Amycolatopsis alba DSM 44262 TaxID=1125972 RepID=A0A229RLK5_AMYAL|nr:ATP-binding protein [Amycolatopsis alba DSM 44262]